MKGSNLKFFFLGVALVATGLWAMAVTIPNTFSAGEVLSAAKINANFAALKTAVDALEATVTGKQNRVTGNCAAGDTIRSINADGSVTCGTSTRASAWISSTGNVITSSPGVTWVITKVGTGLYCIQTSPNVLSNYRPIVATINAPDNSPGQINVNTGWGSACNPYGGYSVSTTNAAGAAADRAFSIVVP
ncbi:hypothetical protein [uncultured Meiothermus sp.]|jgi:hypothetical protein|uniref:hypothetical protein n=1 Tax=uncultured Meiothermus sp. TaxID=157471 RepID=UPI00260DD045|nr:hypothetical protein [uncultured Meiothermus sp.]